MLPPVLGSTPLIPLAILPEDPPLLPPEPLPPGPLSSEPPSSSEPPLLSEPPSPSGGGVVPAGSIRVTFRVVSVVYGLGTGVP